MKNRPLIWRNLLFFKSYFWCFRRDGTLFGWALKAYLKSELDINTYCDQHNLSDQRLIYWMGRYYDQKKDLIPALYGIISY